MKKLSFLQRQAEQISGLQKTIEDRSEGVLLVDLAKPDWSILYNNEAWLRITGMAQEEVLGGHMFHIFTPAGQTKVPFWLVDRLPFAGRSHSLNVTVGALQKQFSCGKEGHSLCHSICTREAVLLWERS